MNSFRQPEQRTKDRTEYDISKPLSKVISHIDDKGFARASLAYRWYEAAWFRDSSMMVMGLCEAGGLLKASQNPAYLEAEASAKRVIGFLWKSLGNFNSNVKKALSLDPSSGRFKLLENHVPARIGEDGGYFSCVQDDKPYSDAQEENPYIRLRQYDSVPLTLMATEKLMETCGGGALDAATKKMIASNLKDLTEYMLKIYRTPGANAWELDDDEVHAYTVASISRGIRSAMYLADRLDVDLSTLGNLNSKVMEIDEFLEKTFVRGNILYKSVESAGGVAVAETPNHKIDASEIFIFTLFKPKLSAAVEKATIRKIERELFKGNALPTRYKKDPYFSGGRWPLLGLEFARYYAEQGDMESADKILKYVKGQHLDLAGDGTIPEQELVDPECPNEDLDNWFKKNGGKVIGELGWAEAEYLVAVAAYKKASEASEKEALIEAVRAK